MTLSLPAPCKAWRSELPPICFLLIKIFGTVFCPVISRKASCIVLPLAEVFNSTTLKSDVMDLIKSLVESQYGQYDFRKIKILLLSIKF